MKHTKGKLLKSLVCDVTPNVTHINIKQHPRGGHNTVTNFTTTYSEPTFQHKGFACVVVIPPTTLPTRTTFPTPLTIPSSNPLSWRCLIPESKPKAVLSRRAQLMRNSSSLCSRAISWELNHLILETHT